MPPLHPAAVWLARRPDGCMVFLGLCGGPVVCERGALGDAGATVPSAPASELVALHWTLGFLWSLTSAVDGLAPGTIFSDCFPAVQQTLGLWRACCQTTLIHCNRRVLQSLGEAGVHCTLRHIPGHAGIPGNELADCVAKWCRQG